MSFEVVHIQGRAKIVNGFIITCILLAQNTPMSAPYPQKEKKYSCEDPP